MKRKGELAAIVSAASVYTGIIIGAGFASGQELMRFFAGYGWPGLAGALISGAVLAVTGWAVLDVCIAHGIRDYGTFIRFMLGEKIGAAISAAVNAFICVLFCAMLAGAGALGREAFGLPFTAGAAILAALCFITLLFGMEGIIRANTVLAPIMVAGSILFGWRVLDARLTETSHVFAVFGVFRQFADSFVWSGVIYASYNLITSVSVLAGMSGRLPTRRAAAGAGLLGGLVMGGLALFLSAPLILRAGDVRGLEIPLLRFASEQSGAINALYMFVLVAAMYTTAVSNGYAAMSWLEKLTGASKLRLNIVICSVGVAASHLGFSAFVGGAYPVFGYLGIFEIAVILIFFFFHKNAFTGKNKGRSGIHDG